MMTERQKAKRAAQGGTLLPSGDAAGGSATSGEVHKTLAVRVIRTEGQSALVEYVDVFDLNNLRRVYVPADIVEGGVARADALEMGIPYGEDWAAKVGSISVTPQVVATALRNSGIWTVEDARANPGLVQGVLAGVYGLDLSKLLAK